MPRRKEIMRIFRDMELVEQLGSGNPRILQAYGKECFHFSENYTRMTFPALEKLSAEGLNGGLNEEENKLLLLIEKNQEIQLKNLFEVMTNMSKRTLERYIAQLAEKGLIERKGSRKTGGYFIIEKSGNERK